MPGVNLTRDEAAIRSTLVKTHSYRIDLDLTTSAETFIAKTTVKFSGLKPGQSTFIDAVGKSVISATLNGQSFDTKFDLRTILSLPFNQEWFSVPPHAPHGQNPKLGTLHPSMVKVASTAYKAATQ